MMRTDILTKPVLSAYHPPQYKYQKLQYRQQTWPAHPDAHPAYYLASESSADSSPWDSSQRIQVETAQQVSQIQSLLGSEVHPCPTDTHPSFSSLPQETLQGLLPRIPLNLAKLANSELALLDEDPVPHALDRRWVHKKKLATS